MNGGGLFYFVFLFAWMRCEVGELLMLCSAKCQRRMSEHWNIACQYHDERRLCHSGSVHGATNNIEEKNTQDCVSGIVVGTWGYPVAFGGQRAASSSKTSKLGRLEAPVPIGPSPIAENRAARCRCHCHCRCRCRCR